MEEEVGKKRSVVLTQEAGRDGQLWRWQGDSLISKNGLALDRMGLIDYDDQSKGSMMIGFPPHNGINQIYKFEDGHILDLRRDGSGSRFALEVESPNEAKKPWLNPSYQKGRQGKQEIRVIG